MGDEIGDRSDSVRFYIPCQCACNGAGAGDGRYRGHCLQLKMEAHLFFFWICCIPSAHPEHS